MREAQVSRSALLKWLLIGAGWTLFALFFASEVLVRGAYAGRPLEIWRALSGWLICALLWLIATTLILWLARRFPLEHPRWLTSTLFHLAAGSLLSLLLLALYALITSTAGLDPASQGFSTSFRNQIAWSFHSQFLTCWMVNLWKADLKSKVVGPTALTVRPAEVMLCHKPLLTERKNR